MVFKGGRREYGHYIAHPKFVPELKCVIHGEFCQFGMVRSHKVFSVYLNPKP